MKTADYNAADNPFAVSVGNATSRKASKTSYVLSHQPKSFDWPRRYAKPHSLKIVEDTLFEQVCQQLNQIIQLN